MRPDDRGAPVAEQDQARLRTPPVGTPFASPPAMPVREPERDGNRDPDVDRDTEDVPAQRDPVEPPMADQTPDRAVTPEPAGPATVNESDVDSPMLGPGADRFRTGWHELQADFVDDPKRAVESAERLVAEALEELTRAVTERKHTLDEGWRDGETEDLRMALRRYRGFLDRLLEV
jgi:hypothetical protein